MKIFNTPASHSSLSARVLSLLVVALFFLTVTGSYAQNALAKQDRFNKYTRKGMVSVELGWSYDQANAVSHFILERSYDGKTFTDAALIFTSDDKDMRQYGYSDHVTATAAANVYYRLKIVDMNENYTYSDDIKVRKEDVKSGIKQVIALEDFRGEIGAAY